MESVLDTISNLKNIKSVKIRCKEFANVWGTVNFSSLSSLEQDLMTKCLENVMRDQSLFPSITYFLVYVLENKNLEGMVFLHEKMSLKIHEVRFVNGKSLLRYLVEPKSCVNYHGDVDRESKPLIDYFLKTAAENYCDSQGYSYFHAACFAGDIDTVQRFIKIGVDVNLDTFAYSPVHIAAKYRRVEVLRVLLEHDADPNKRDNEQSTPLHAIARLRVCDCVELCADNCSNSDQRRPVDAMVELLVAKGAKIEARNRDGLTPLESAVMSFDFELTKSLLSLGASMDSLNDNMMLDVNYTPYELGYYPVALHVVETIRLLVSNGFEMQLWTRYKLINFWMTVRGNDFNSLIPGIEEFGFFIKKEVVDCLNRKREEFKPHAAAETLNYLSVKYNSQIMQEAKKEVEKLKGIMVKKGISLYQLCQMSHRQGYSIVRTIKNWRLPALSGLKHLRIFVKAHVANILMRPQFERFAADLFITEHCKLNLPYYVGWKVAEYFSDEDLFHLIEQTNEKDLERPWTADGADICVSTN
ncbi:hypothetical protein TKK_0008485 [Trichogramma kaykai]